MPVIDDITAALKHADTVVESTIGDEGSKRYALEAGIRIHDLPAVRAADIDSAELIGFIRNTTAEHRHAEYHEIAALIVNRFDLDGNA